MKRLLTVIPVALIVLTAFSPPGPKPVRLPKKFGKEFAKLTAPSGDAFLFIACTEVSNLSYRTFLTSLTDQGKTAEFEAACWDTLGWRQVGAYNEPYVRYYHSHPAYDHYPAVNIPAEGAVLYCRWLTDQLNREFGSADVRFEARLPSAEEWIGAASAANPDAPYAWGSHALRDHRNTARCNFMVVGDECIARDPQSRALRVECAGGSAMGAAGYLSDNADITAPVRAYAPAPSGCFNMNGNVAELVGNGGMAMGGSWRSTGYDVRNTSSKAFTGPCPDVGFRPLVTVVAAR
jgi:formylglycine-generating enzyme required for sulfatase activity